MAGNYESVQAKAIASRGHEVSVISIYEKSFWSFFRWMRVSHRVVDRVHVYESCTAKISIPFIRRCNKYIRKNIYRRALERCEKEQGKPDIVHAHIISTASFAIFFKEDYHLPYVITEHWTKVNTSDVPVWLRRMSAAYHKADRVICVSQVLADSLLRNFQIESVVINNMVSDIFFKSAKNERKDQSFRFIAVGAFRRNKGFDILVEAFAQCRFSSDVSLCIVGDGEEFASVEAKIRTYDLKRQVKLMGTRSPEEVSELLCNSDCFVLSSRLETFAIVVIEAMAKGLPVIATRCGGPETFVRPSEGLLIDKENVEQLSHALQYMVSRHSDYDSEHIRKYCHDHFSEDAIAQQIIDVYNDVLKNHKQA